MVDLVPVAWREGQYQVETFGSATASINKGTVQENSDGSSTSIFVSIPAGLNRNGSGTPQGVRITIPFRGRAFGIRWARGRGNPNIGDFSVLVDGVVYPVPNRILSTQDQSIFLPPGYAQGDAGQVVVDDLPDMVEQDGERIQLIHQAQIYFPSSDSHSSSWVLYGLLLDKAAGYQPPPRTASVVNTPAVVPTTATSVAAVYASNGGNPRGISAVLYANTSATTAHTVTVLYNGAVSWQKTIQPGDAASFPGAATPPIATDALLKHRVDSGSDVLFTVLGGN